MIIHINYECSNLQVLILQTFYKPVTNLTTLQTLQTSQKTQR
eukprot:UN26955